MSRLSRLDGGRDKNVSPFVDTCVDRRSGKYVDRWGFLTHVDRRDFLTHMDRLVRTHMDRRGFLTPPEGFSNELI